MTKLPPAISFSPISIPLSSGGETVLSRRDLFDARFQLISDDDAGAKDGRSEVDFVDAPSDLVPGVYEGGLKTWECSLDIVDCLDSIYGAEIGSKIRGKRVIELGCGTAIPSMYLLHSVFAADPAQSARDVVVHLQDYNGLVLRLVTLPNVILAWYMSPASSAYRASATTQAEQTEDAEQPPPADPTQAGELPITPVLTAAFLESLKTYRVHLKFFSGSWATLDVDAPDRGPYDILLTSETIYRTASLQSLVNLMRRATVNQGRTESLEEAASRLTLEDAESLKLLAREPYLCLVAAKLVYFGVGGGVSEFVDAIERPKEGGRLGTVQTVLEMSRGVKRSVMRVVWEAV
ncbi:hypothetical protein L226DRAFT_537017 [Lentinus tigrinus ALCF2SS1-7]|uniref:protein-histidine N-methyltransferase n=1 Tax=Lentinus tigrinus ALCF2SS1-6 TaxID=1328759 RepID=A0A5C2RUY9_9APHY|nr:hypothetical protein L227DRAFT_509789 [Lentinus tigrinus ALCF2SS1-6]RPD72500.1 hypothetical protein L226DRAFT_537017 [Lentinus tigrinus ALCF2SS1-7]